MMARQHTSGMVLRQVLATARRSAVRYARRARGAMLIMLLAAAFAATLYTLFLLRAATRQNTIIASLEARRDTPLDIKHASSEALIARQLFLLERDRIEEAQALLDASASFASPEARSRLLYNQANAHVRRAFAVIEGGDLDKAIPLIKLAKDAYREALRLKPDAWDAKHNYDVAMRLVRDFPGYEQDGEEMPPDAEKKLWTDLPGVPKGLP